MREFKFRAWDHKKNEYNTKGILHYWLCHVLPESGEVHNDPEFYSKYTIEQYAGLKDMENKDLDWWENDLFMIHDSLYQLIFKNGSFIFQNLKSPHYILCSEVLGWGVDIYDFKIGNIHENKDLLNERNLIK